MKILGLKLTHDGSVCLIDNNEIKFCIELEKLDNNARFTEIPDSNIIKTIVENNGYALSEIDYFAIDGWGGYQEEELAIQPRLRIGKDHNFLSIDSNGESYDLPVAQYMEKNVGDELMKTIQGTDLRIGNQSFSYSSYLHVVGHLLSAYCTSPFAKLNQDSYALIWDGGMFPRLYHFNNAEKKIESLGPIFLLIGNIYTIFSQHFGPFKVESGFAKDSLSVAGKVMAYIGKGKVIDELMKLFNDIMNDGFEKPMGYANVFANKFKQDLKDRDLHYKDEDILRSFHQFLQELLIDKLRKKISRYGYKTKNLCIAGGCGLNIKWNSGIRNANIFDNVYVPPFPNDSGSAVGVALAKKFELTNDFQINWTVYSGPEAIVNAPYEGWSQRSCTIKELAHFIHENDEPVILMNGRAELGPRALGNRSIIGSPKSNKMKDTLNRIKHREDYRPVSPICLQERAEQIFEPGTSDPFMLYDHNVKSEWIERIPAVMHVDGSARLQTVSKNDNALIHELVSHFEVLSGIPVICNTSANFNGKGFFPDIFSATKWGGVNYVWNNNTMYYKKNIEQTKE